MVLLLRLSAVLAIGALSACASSGDKDGRKRGDPPITFKRYELADADGDGKLSLEEARTIPEFAEGLRSDQFQISYERLFIRLDSDHSGLLSWSEVRAARFPLYRYPKLQERDR